MATKRTFGKGDGGETSLVYGTRVSKTDVRIQAVGKLDSLHACLGLVHENLQPPQDEALMQALWRIQKHLILLGGQVPIEPERQAAYIDQMPVKTADEYAWIDAWTGALRVRPELQSREWILYGKEPAAARLDFASKACREAELALWCVREAQHPVPAETLAYINRLSLWLFLMARQVTQQRQPPVSSPGT